MDSFRVIWVDDGITLIKCACGQELFVHLRAELVDLWPDECKCGKKYQMIQYVEEVQE